MAGRLLRAVIAVPSAVLLAAGAAAARLGAQEVRGLVVAPDGERPAASVLVELLAASGVQVARAVTAPSGHFVLRAPVAGRYRVRALRIGFRPTVSDDVHVGPDDVAQVRLVLGEAPVALAEIRVTARSACRRVGEVAGDGHVATVWEEARKALALASLTASARRHRLRVVTYERDLDGDRVARQVSRTVETTDARAFRAVAVDSLLRHGFVVQQGDALAFHGPDADVLLSDAFVANYCLRLTSPPDADSSSIAIAFEPSARRDVIQVRGTLTLARHTGELRELRFGYVGLPDEAAMAGGSLTFARASGGGWFVRRWRLVMPVLDVQGGAEARPGVPPEERVSARGVREAGGEVMAVSVDGEEVLSAPLRRVTGRVVREDGSRGVAGARVALAGTGHDATTDDDGRFALQDVLPARYRLLVTTPLLDSMGGVSPGGDADLTSGDLTERTLVLWSPDAVYRELCRVERDDRRGALLRVRVRHAATGAVLPGATITLRWGGVERHGRVRGRQQERVLRTGEDGQVAYCGVPRDLPIRLRVTAGDAAAPEAVVVISPLRPFLGTEVRLAPR